MKILLTGATGFIGTNFILQLYNKYEIIALVRKSSNVNKIKDYCKIYYYDGNFNKIFHNLKNENIYGIVHLATKWLHDYKYTDIDSLVDSNIFFGLHLLELS
ncbi:TPA: NAD(P)-dependent oxidoreductase, partial [Campylobacter coli]|nr:NAD(P)-dependent oxidoreductase [Campylobacter coli]